MITDQKFPYRRWRDLLPWLAVGYWQGAIEDTKGWEPFERWKGNR